MNPFAETPEGFTATLEVPQATMLANAVREVRGLIASQAAAGPGAARESDLVPAPDAAPKPDDGPLDPALPSDEETPFDTPPPAASAGPTPSASGPGVVPARPDSAPTPWPGTEPAPGPDSAPPPGSGAAPASNATSDPAPEPGDAARWAEDFVRALAQGGDETGTLHPDLERLYPMASRDDPALALEFRRLTKADLDRQRIARLDRLEQLLTAARPRRWFPVRIVVTPAEADQVLAAFNDVRLVLAARLNIRTAADAEAVQDIAFLTSGGPRSLTGVTYFIASVLADSLAEVLITKSVHDREGTAE